MMSVEGAGEGRNEGPNTAIPLCKAECGVRDAEKREGGILGRKLPI